LRVRVSVGQSVVPNLDSTAFRFERKEVDSTLSILLVCLAEPRAPSSRQSRPVVEPQLIEDVFVCCTRFLRMYFHCVSSRHWPSPLKHQNAGPGRSMLVADKLANGEEPIGSRLRAPHIAIAMAYPRLASFGSSPLASLSATSIARSGRAFLRFSGDGQSRDETQ